MEFCKALFDRGSFNDAVNVKLRDQRMIFLSASAGWGKTIAVQAWVQAHPNARLISARMLKDLQPTPKAPAVLAIDDLQELMDDELQQYLLPLLTRAANTQYILISRAELPSLLCPFSLTGQLAVLDKSALCLSRDVIDTYLASAKLPYSIETSNFLLKESKGYPVAVDCLIEALKNGDLSMEQAVRKATQTVFDYFEQVVFSRFSQEAQAFLLKMAQFAEFTLRMAVMVSGDSDIIQVLEEILHRGQCLYVVAAEHYRFAHIFHRFLIDYQKRKYSVEMIGNLWRRAGLYYELCDEVPDALHCYQQVNDWDKLVELLIRHTRRPPYTTFYFELKEYYLALPPDLVEQSPDLMCSVSMIYSMNMRKQESEYWYQRLESYCRSRAGNDPARKTAVERLAYLRIALPHRGSGKLAQTMLDVLKLVQSEDRCLQCISPTSGIPSLMHGAKDFCPWSRRDEQLYRVFKKPIELLLGSSGIGVADAGLAESRLERCTLKNMTDVMIHAASAINQAEQAGTPDVYFAAAATIARLSIMQGDLVSAQRNLDVAEKMAKTAGNNRLLSNIRAFRIRIFLLEGNTAAINQWMQETAPDELGEFHLLNRYQYMVKARCYILKGAYLGAAELLMRMIPYFEMSEHRYCLMEAQMLLAIAQYRMEEDHWQGLMETALAGMEKYGFIRLPAEEGNALLPLLRSLQERQTGTFRASVLREVTRYAKLYPDYLQPPNLPKLPLTQAEKQVLHLLIQGMTNAEIAQSLHVSVRTVKFHAGNIFAKLNVKNRTEAIALSRKLFE